MINKNIKEAAIEVYKEEGSSAVITFLKKREVEEKDIADFLDEFCTNEGCQPETEDGKKAYDMKCVCGNEDPNHLTKEVLENGCDLYYTKDETTKMGSPSGTMGELFDFSASGFSDSRFTPKKFSKQPKKKNWFQKLFNI